MRTKKGFTIVKIDVTTVPGFSSVVTKHSQQVSFVTSN